MTYNFVPNIKNLQYFELSDFMQLFYCLLVAFLVSALINCILVREASTLVALGVMLVGLC